MLPARHRLRQSADFSSTVRGIRSGSRLLVVSARRSVARSGEPPRVGFVVSKAVGNAVIRNRTKRRLRALIALRLSHLPPGVDVVIRANPAAASSSATHLDAALGALIDSALSRLHSAGRPEGARARDAEVRGKSR